MLKLYKYTHSISIIDLYDYIWYHYTDITRGLLVEFLMVGSNSYKKIINGTEMLISMCVILIYND